MNESNIRLHAVGDLSALPDVTYKGLLRGIDITKNNKRLDLNLALSYSSRWEIIDATKEIARKIKAGEIEPDDCNEELFSSCLSTFPFPDPELMIRTSGEMRISNFLLWQIAYAELYFTSVLWPDFRKPHFVKAIEEYQKRERRFGKTSEQLKQSNEVI